MKQHLTHSGAYSFGLLADLLRRDDELLACGRKRAMIESHAKTAALMQIPELFWLEAAGNSAGVGRIRQR